MSIQLLRQQAVFVNLPEETRALFSENLGLT